MSILWKFSIKIARPGMLTRPCAAALATRASLAEINWTLVLSTGQRPVLTSAAAWRYDFAHTNTADNPRQILRGLNFEFGPVTFPYNNTVSNHRRKRRNLNQR